MHVFHALHASWHLNTLSGKSWTWSWISGLNHIWNSLIIISEILAPKFGSTNSISNLSEIWIEIQNFSPLLCDTYVINRGNVYAFFSTLIIWKLNFRFQSYFKTQNFVLFSSSPLINSDISASTPITIELVPKIAFFILPTWPSANSLFPSGSIRPTVLRFRYL